MVSVTIYGGMGIWLLFDSITLPFRLQLIQLFLLRRFIVLKMIGVKVIMLMNKYILSYNKLFMINEKN